MEKADKRILVVDDEQDLCEILSFNIQIEGYHVDTANSAEEALEMDIASYDLLLLDGSCGSEMLDMASVYDIFESYMKPVLKQNSQKLSIEQGGFLAYRLVTDNDGEVFYQQVVNSMKETLGSQGVQLLVQRMKDREERTGNAEAIGNNVENNHSLEN